MGTVGEKSYNDLRKIDRQTDIRIRLKQSELSSITQKRSRALESLMRVKKQKHALLKQKIENENVLPGALVRKSKALQTNAAENLRHSKALKKLMPALQQKVQEVLLLRKRKEQMQGQILAAKQDLMEVHTDNLLQSSRALNQVGANSVKNHVNESSSFELGNAANTGSRIGDTTNRVQSSTTFEHATDEAQQLLEYDANSDGSFSSAIDPHVRISGNEIVAFRDFHQRADSRNSQPNSQSNDTQTDQQGHPSDQQGQKVTFDYQVSSGESIHIEVTPTMEREVAIDLSTSSETQYAVLKEKSSALVAALKGIGQGGSTIRLRHLQG